MIKEELLDLILRDPRTQKVVNTLLRLGYIDNSNANDSLDIDNMVITNLGREFLDGTVKTIDLNWIDEYRTLFKEKNPIKIGIKQNVVSKMEKFIKLYGYTKEDILEATKLYLDQLPGYDNNQMASADYFISFTPMKSDAFTEKKELKSQLLKWVEIYKNGDLQISTSFIEKR